MNEWTDLLIYAPLKTVTEGQTTYEIPDVTGEIITNWVKISEHNGKFLLHCRVPADRVATIKGKVKSWDSYIAKASNLWGDATEVELAKKSIDCEVEDVDKDGKTIKVRMKVKDAEDKLKKITFKPIPPHQWAGCDSEYVPPENPVP